MLINQTKIIFLLYAMIKTSNLRKHKTALPNGYFAIGKRCKELFLFMSVFS